MMKMVRIFVVFQVLLSVGGCGTKDYQMPSEIWENLGPLDKEFDKSVTELNEYLVSANNRKDVIYFVDSKLRSQYLNYKEQIRLGIIVRVLQYKSTPKEYDSVCRLITQGKEFPDYYGLALSVKPPFLLTSIEVFKYADDIYGHFYHPDGGMKVKYDIKERYAEHLYLATGHNFGESYDKWHSWWLEEGRFLKYDYNTGTYKQ